MEVKDKDLAKLLLSFNGQGTTLINTEESHYKFWNIQRSGSVVTTYYGRLGKSIRSTEKDLGNEFSANRFMMDKISEKRRKGYEKITI